MVNNVHVGAGAEASRKRRTLEDAARLDRRRQAQPRQAGLPDRRAAVGVQPAELHLRVEVDGKVVNDLDRPVLMVAIGNGANIGGGTEVTPHADPEDGSVDVMVSRAVCPLAKLGYTMKLAARARTSSTPTSTTSAAHRLGLRRGVLVQRPTARSRARAATYWHVEPGAYRSCCPLPDNRPTRCTGPSGW